jgi:Lon protease-like protein
MGAYHPRMSSPVRVDFSRPMALFPLPAVPVFPHTAEWLVAFEPRYRQLVEDCLRARTNGEILSAAPFALATYAARDWPGERVGDPPLRPAVCVVKMVDHRQLQDGRHQILVHGVARARIESIAEPDGRRLYRIARLAPMLSRVGGPRRLPVLEGMIGALLAHGELARMQRFEQIRNWIRRGSIPTEVLVEQINVMLSRSDDVRYALLAEPSSKARARRALRELTYLRDLIDHAAERTASASQRGVHDN